MERGISWEDRIKGAYASLRPSEQKVASFFLAHAGELESLTIGELASAAGVSEPTVIRCVRGLGYRGYRAFKGALRGREAGEESSFDHLGGFSLRPWDRREDLPLTAVGTHLEQAARTLASARLIDLYSVENSCAPASDLLTKLTYLGLRCRFCTDAYLQQISAAHLGKGDVAVAFSRSGRSVDTVKALRLAKKAGAATIAVTGERTALLSRYADLTLSVGGGAQTVYGNAIFSRVADLAVVDMLYMGIILSDYERFSRNLDRSGQVIADRGYAQT